MGFDAVSGAFDAVVINGCAPLGAVNLFIDSCLLFPNILDSFTPFACVGVPFYGEVDGGHVFLDRVKKHANKTTFYLVMSKTGGIQ